MGQLSHLQTKFKEATADVVKYPLGSEARLRVAVDILAETKALLASKWVGERVVVYSSEVGPYNGTVTKVDALWHVGILEALTVKLDSGGFLGCSSKYVELSSVQAKAE